MEPTKIEPVVEKKYTISSNILKSDFYSRLPHAEKEILKKIKGLQVEIETQADLMHFTVKTGDEAHKTIVIPKQFILC